MVAGDVGHLRPPARMLQDQPYHLIMGRIPVPGFPQPPAIDDVAHQIHLLAGNPAEEIDQEIAAATPRAEMQIRNENRAIARAGRGLCCVHGRSKYNPPRVVHVKIG